VCNWTNRVTLRKRTVDAAMPQAQQDIKKAALAFRLKLLECNPVYGGETFRLTLTPIALASD